MYYEINICRMKNFVNVLLKKKILVVICIN